jgi:hypothetical protein
VGESLPHHFLKGIFVKDYEQINSALAFYDAVEREALALGQKLCPHSIVRLRKLREKFAQFDFFTVVAMTTDRDWAAYEINGIIYAAEKGRMCGGRDEKAYWRSEAIKRGNRFCHYFLKALEQYVKLPE